LLDGFNFLGNQCIFIIDTVLYPELNTRAHLRAVGRDVKASVIVEKGAIGQHTGLLVHLSNIGNITREAE